MPHRRNIYLELMEEYAMGFLQQWYDDSLDAQPELDLEEELELLGKRYMETYYMAKAAADVPRRLGGDASPDELKEDKKFSKGVAAMCISLMNANRLDEDDFTISDERIDTLHRKGAQIEWHDWFVGHVTFLRTELVRLATTALRSGKIKEGNRLCNVLQNELTQLHNRYIRSYPDRNPAISGESV